MKSLQKRLRAFLSSLKNRIKRAEEIKAGKKWDSIVEELRSRK
ncbi:hypothetical protein [Prochlorococcus marinus]|nr:hypothetical protein [Prochlorococcus marinus]